MADASTSVFDIYRTKPEKVWEDGRHYDKTNVVIRIAKVGGGEVGKKYDGEWLAQVTDQYGTILHQTHQFAGKNPHTHYGIALLYAHMLYADQIDNQLEEHVKRDLFEFSVGLWD